MARTLEELLAAARARIGRFTPAEALAATRRGAILVDTRSDAARMRTGVVPGSIHIPRTVLEWRLERGGAWRNPHVDASEREVILLCDDGESSSLAAATLVELGLDAGDVVGGFAAWLESGLPVTPVAPASEPGRLPGMGPPDASVDALT